MDMRIDASGQFDTLIPFLAHVICEALHTKLESSGHKSDVRSFPESIVDHGLIFICGDTACTVHKIPSSCRVGVDAIDRAQDELLLKL